VLGQRRHKPPGLPFEQLPKIDLVVISHNHYDHLDLPTLRRLQERDAPLVLAGLGTAALLQKNGVTSVADVDWWEHRDVGGLRVTFAPAQHWSTRALTDRYRNLWGSWYLSDGRQTVYFAGDTGDGPHFRAIRDRLGPPDLALIPIGAYLPRWFMRSQHVDPAEAVAAHLTLGARRSVAVHWGTFQQADEGMDDPPADLARAREQRGVPAEDFVVLDNGQSLEVAPRAAR
jgi:L-ascorbate metabolism protein UlaG (beta-lactamase superfamily)